MNTEQIRKDIARMPKPGEPVPNMSWHGLFGVACRLADGAEELLDEIDRLRHVIAQTRTEASAEVQRVADSWQKVAARHESDCAAAHESRRSATAEVAALRAQLAGLRQQVEAEQLIDVIAAAMCAQAEQAETEGNEPWWAWSTDDIARYLASAIAAALAPVPADPPAEPHESLTFLPAGAPGRLDERRVHVRYADGCVTAFPQGAEVTVRKALDSHANLHGPVAAVRPDEEPQ